MSDSRSAFAASLLVASGFISRQRTRFLPLRLLWHRTVHQQIDCKCRELCSRAAHRSIHGAHVEVCEASPISIRDCKEGCDNS